MYLVSKLYVLLVSIFCTIIISGNLIFQKFIKLYFFGFSFHISVGVLLYPIAFLISDLVTEFYGARQARFMVKVSLICSFLVMFIVYIADSLVSSQWSRVDSNTFSLVFGVYSISVFASIIASYLGQIVDIYVFSYIKRFTQDKHLWLRSNASTLAGQIIDTMIVVVSLLLFKVIPADQTAIVILSSVIFKIIATFMTTPILYLCYFLTKKISMVSKKEF